MAPQRCVCHTHKHIWVSAGVRRASIKSTPVRLARVLPRALQPLQPESKQAKMCHWQKSMYGMMQHWRTASPHKNRTFSSCACAASGCAASSAVACKQAKNCHWRNPMYGMMQHWRTASPHEKSYRHYRCDCRCLGPLRYRSLQTKKQQVLLRVACWNPPQKAGETRETDGGKGDRRTWGSSCGQK